eukprot:gb/GEZN01006731.1/.p1 GENE.gb/GEZN01006731.1/~~gb/GEZN01006731.1/.p1  ORF type:complete len:510 (+),score=56.53 gb/GEZN01006731.1/:32-1561(+)
MAGQKSKLSVLVIGSGISGLSLAHYLKQRCAVTLVDRAPRTGGWMNTRRRGSFLFETGPRSLLARRGAEDCLELVEELGLEQEVILSDPSASRRFVWSAKRGALLLPSGLDFSSLAALRPPVFSPQFLAGIAREPFVPRRAHDIEDETVYDWACRRFNSHVADWLIDPLVAGIYSGDPKQLSVDTCFARFVQLEQQHGSVIRGALKPLPPARARSPFADQVWANGTYSFKHGIQVLADTLLRQMDSEVTVQLGPSGCVKGLAFAEDGGMACFTAADGSLEWRNYDYICSTLQAPPLARLLSLEDCSLPPPKDPLSNDPALISAHQKLLQILSQGQAASVWVINLGYQASVLPAKMRGFGLLVPTSQQLEVLGISFDSCIFPGQGGSDDNASTRITVMLGGARHPWLSSLPEAQILERAMTALDLCIGSKLPPPEEYLCSLQTNCIPQYSLGHGRRVEEAQQLARLVTNSRLRLSGTSFGRGVSVNDCIGTARSVVNDLRRERPYEFMSR